MKKAVVYIAILSMFFELASCETATSNKASQAEKPAEERPENHNEPLKIKLEKSDSLSEAGEINQNVDPLAVDSTAYKLPEPENPEEINWDAEDEVPALNDAAFQPDTLKTIEVEDYDYEEFEVEEEAIGLINGDVPLRAEKIIGSEIVHVMMPDYRSIRDSILDIVEERMRIHPQEIEQNIVVEKWFSPVNFRGYKFNRKKLMLYGVDKNDEVSIYYYLGEYYLGFDNRMFYLDETTRNLGFETVKDSMIVNYLQEYDH